MNKNDNDLAMRVCAFCGSPRPEELLPQCAHGLVAIVCGKERRAFARLFVAFQVMHAQRAAALVLLGNAVDKGTATRDRAPAFDYVGENVIPLHDRDILHAPRIDADMPGWEFDDKFHHRGGA